MLTHIPHFSVDLPHGVLTLPIPGQAALSRIGVRAISSLYNEKTFRIGRSCFFV